MDQIFFMAARNPGPFLRWRATVADLASSEMLGWTAVVTPAGDLSSPAGTLPQLLRLSLKTGVRDPKNIGVVVPAWCLSDARGAVVNVPELHAHTHFPFTTVLASFFAYF